MHRIVIPMRATMFKIIPEKNHQETCKYLFQEGVCYAKKDFKLAKDPEIDVPNLQVIKLVKSFKSRESSLPHLKKQTKRVGRPLGGPPGDRPRPRPEGDRPRFRDRDGYRAGPHGPPGEYGDKAGAPSDYQPSFSAGGGGGRGFGRGSGGFGGAPGGAGFE